MPDLIGSQAPLKDPLVDTDTFIGYDTNNDEWRAKLGVVEDAIWRRMYPSLGTTKYVIAALEGAELTTSNAHATGIACFVPFRIWRPTVMAKMVCRVIAAGSNIDMAIYANGSGKPTGSEIRKTGSTVANSANSNVEPAFASGGNLTFDYSGTAGTYYPGIYWMGLQTDSALLTTRAYKAAHSVIAQLFGASTLTIAAGDTSNRACNALQTTLAFGTWGDLTNATFTEVSGANAQRNFIPEYKVA